MSFDVVSLPTANQELGLAWESIRAQCPHLQHPQLHWRWIELTAKIRANVQVGVYQQAGEIMAMLAFERVNDRRGVPVSGILTDQHAMIAKPENEISPRTFLKAIGLSSWSFDHLPVSQQCFLPFTHVTDYSDNICFDNNFEDYWVQIEAEHRSWCQQMARKRRKIERELGPLRFELHTEQASALDALLVWKQQQLIREGYPNVYAEDWAKRLLALVARNRTQTTAARKAVPWEGWMSVLYAGNQMVATHLGQRSGSQFNSWIPAFDFQLRHYSPGAILQIELTIAAAAEGIQWIDLGRGQNPLKKKLSNGQTELRIGQVHRHAWKQAISNRLAEFRRRLKKSSLANHWMRQVRKINNKLNRQKDER